MSSTELYTVRQDGTVVHEKDFKNAHLGAVLVWSEMAKKYNLPFSVSGDLQPVWNLWKDKRVPVSHRIVMGATFDNVIIRKSEFARYANAVSDYCADFCESGHLSDQASFIMTLLFRDDVIGVCWNQTSVSSSPWYVDQDDGEYREYNVNLDTDHWYLFDEIDRQESE